MVNSEWSIENGSKWPSMRVVFMAVIVYVISGRHCE
jgi:hypothetical protein